MTVDDIITKARYRLADYSDESYSDAMFFEYINDGTKDFAMTGCCQDKYNKTSGAIAATGLALSNLTYKYINVYHVTNTDTPLHFAPIYESRYWSPSAGTPTGYSVWNDIIYFDYTFTPTDLDVYYTYVPDDISAVGNTAPLPEKWAPALVAYCVFRCRDADRDDGFAMRAYAEYDAIRQTAAKIYESLLMRGGYG